MVGPTATTLLQGARMPAGATINMKGIVPRASADRAVDRRELVVRNSARFLRTEECFFLTPFYRTPLCAAFSRPKLRGVAPARPEPLGAVFCPGAEIGANNL
jgi:hypothetical protein